MLQNTEICVRKNIFVKQYLKGNGYIAIPLFVYWTTKINMLIYKIKSIQKEVQLWQDKKD